jgi:hypothetical protein
MLHSDLCAVSCEIVKKVPVAMCDQSDLPIVTFNLFPDSGTDPFRSVLGKAYPYLLRYVPAGIS